MTAARKNVRKNWKPIRVTTYTYKILSEEARLMQRAREHSTALLGVPVIEKGPHADKVSFDTVIRQLIAYRNKHRERRDRSAKERKARKNGDSAAKIIETI